jgi:hypothetical protein
VRYWISWNEYSEDYRPLTFPPQKPILGWWKTGESGDGSHATLVACLDTDTEHHAKTIIESEWPNKDDEDWRFCEVKDDDFVPGDRFPLSEWMQERFSKEKKDG